MKVNQPTSSGSGLVTLLSEKQNETCDNLQVKLQENKGWDDTNGFDDGIVASFVDNVEYKFKNHRKILYLIYSSEKLWNQWKIWNW